MCVCLAGDCRWTAAIRWGGHTAILALQSTEVRLNASSVFNQGRPPPGRAAPRPQSLYPAGSYDCCIWQVGTEIEGAHSSRGVEGHPSLPGPFLWGWGVGEWEWVRSCSTFLF